MSARDHERAARFDLPWAAGRGGGTRDGVVFRRAAGDGHPAGLAELTPLGGLHAFTAEELLGALREAPGTTRAGDGGAAAAATFLREAADSWQAFAKRPLPPGTRLAVNALCPADVPGITAWLAETPRAAVLKLKLGRVSHASERAALEHLLTEAPPELRLRLDANRAFDFPEAHARLAWIPRDRIDYVEEPTREPEDALSLRDALGLPLAFDETLREAEHAALVGEADVWVHKPTVDLRIPPRRDGGGRQVITSCFESDLGLWWLARLAFELAPEETHGLGTETWVEGRTSVPAYDARSGTLDLGAWPPRPVSRLRHALGILETGADVDE